MYTRDSRPDGIVVLDFGGQYCHLIARRVREMNVYSEIMPCNASPEEILRLDEAMEVRGIILSGSPWSVGREGAPRLDGRVLDLGFPVLGLCYGHQIIAFMNGGDVQRGKQREYGVTDVVIDRAEGVLRGLAKVERVWMSHGDTVYAVPDEFKVMAHTNISPVAAYRHRARPIYGLQWHPEVVHTTNGMVMLRNFIFEICGCSPNWAPQDTIKNAIGEIEKAVGASKAIIALSGGVDSSVAAAITTKALGGRLIAVHVDHGFMRMNESEAIEKTFRNLGVDLVVIQAQERFIELLRGVVDPEEKRRIIGKEFIRVFEDEAKKAGADYLIQGTIYPDRIESGFRRHSDKIKTHHNVGGLPINIEFKAILEPLKDLYKDEVRALGQRLGLPDSIVFRQPFPGPGLAVRIMGEVTEDKLNILREVDAIVCEEVETSGLGKDVWMYFAVLTDTKSTGVKGDERAYGWTVAIRIIESLDGMTASFRKVSWDLLERLSTRITNEVPAVIRVVYDITHKPPSTIEWE